MLLRPTWVRYQVLAAGCLLALIAYIHRVGFASAGTYLKLDLGLSDSDWGVVMAAFLVAYAAFEMPWGLAGDRLGARHLLTLVALGWSVLTAAVALLPAAAAPFVLLLVLRFLFGAFQAGAFPALSRVLTDWMPMQERGTAQGCVWMFSRVGGAIAPFLMVALVGQSGSWEFSLLAVAGLGVLWCALFWPWFRNTPESMRSVNPAELALIGGGRARRAGHAHVSWLRLFRSRSVWALCFMYGFGGCSATFFITLLPAYLREHRGLSPQQMQWLSGLPLACGVVACLLGGVVSDWLIRRWGARRWGRRLTGFLGHTCAGFALLSTNWTDQTWALAILLSLTFFCNDLAMGPAWASCADIGGRYAGTLGGAMNTVGNLGGALGALVAGQLMGQRFLLTLGDSEFVLLGNELVFIVFACSFWLGALCWLGVDVTHTLEPATVAS
ncbi:MAG: MFS transporter [Gemmataceae bacterium]|nr:MFS transporter [Gemmataceae bacterium]